MTEYNFKDGDTVTGRFTGTTYTRKAGIWSNAKGTTESDAGVGVGLANPTHGNYMSYERGPNHLSDTYTEAISVSDVQPGDTVIIKSKVSDLGQHRMYLENGLSIETFDAPSRKVDVIRPVEVFGAGTVVKRKADGAHFTILDDNGKCFDHQYARVDKFSIVPTSKRFDKVS